MAWGSFIVCTAPRTFAAKRITASFARNDGRCWLCHSFRASALTQVVAFFNASLVSKLYTGPGTQPRSLHSQE